MLPVRRSLSGKLGDERADAAGGTDNKRGLSVELSECFDDLQRGHAGGRNAAATVGSRCLKRSRQREVLADGHVLGVGTVQAERQFADQFLAGGEPVGAFAHRLDDADQIGAQDEREARRRSAIAPSPIGRSMGFTPATSTLITTSPGPARGSCISTGLGAAPYFSTVLARIVGSSLETS